jgi:hypothetical protein
MKLENIDNKYIKIQSDYLMEGNTIAISVKDCCGNEFTDTIVWDSSSYEPTSKGTIRIGDDLYISNKLVEQPDEIADGIYYITLSVDMFIDEGVIFFENKIRCMLAEKLDDYLDDTSKNKHTELHMLHWAIYISQECICKYDEMCKLFNILWTNLTNSKSSDCGC